jgi:hypothetical protein
MFWAFSGPFPSWFPGSLPLPKALFMVYNHQKLFPSGGPLAFQGVIERGDGD